VLDGEILAWEGAQPLPFGSLQRRLGRKIVTAKTRKDFPIAYVAYDLLEFNGEDFRDHPLSERRARLAEVIEQAAAKAKLTPATQPKTEEALLPGFEIPSVDNATPRQVLRLSPLVIADS